MSKEVNEKWIKDVALFFYQIFSVEYENKEFVKRLLMGGGGNSTLCSTWTHLSDDFIEYRISKKAYNLLLEKVESNDKKYIVKNGDTISIPKFIIEKKYHQMFFNNAKGAENRKLKSKYFHFDHNPSNRKVLLKIKGKIEEHDYSDEYLEELSQYIKQIQTVDLITVEEDDIRTYADQNLKEKLDAHERDLLTKSKFYNLEIL
ncbi:MAG: hypothetical protein ACI312_02030 [Bacilli bacterium]